MSTYTFWIHLPVTSDPQRHADIAHNLWDGLKDQHDDKVSHLVMAWDTRRDDILKVAMSAKAADESAAVAAALRVLRQAAGTDARFLDLAGASASEVRLEEDD